MNVRQLCLSMASLLLLPITVSAQTVVDLVSQQEDFSDFAYLIQSSAHVSENWTTTNPITVFAPNNEAFEFVSGSFRRFAGDPNYSAHLEYLLNCHAVAGALATQDFVLDAEVQTMSRVTTRITSAPPEEPAINGAVVLPNVTDLRATNGLVQGIDGVILPTNLLQNIIEAARSMPQLSIFVSLLEASTGLYEDFQEDASGPFTIFAPVNSAFNNSTGINLDEIKGSKPENYAERMELLDYHIIDGMKIFGDLGDSSRIRISDQTLEARGGSMRVTPDGTINGHAKVTRQDVLVSNGVIHLVDKVLMKSQYESTQVFDASEGLRLGTSLWVSSLGIVCTFIIMFV